MNRKILETLEFWKIKALFEPYLLTEQGCLELQQLFPSNKQERLETAFLEMTDLTSVWLRPKTLRA